MQDDTRTAWPMLRLRSGRMVPLIAGGNGEGEDGDDGGGSGGGAPPAQDDPPANTKTFSQDDLDRIATREKEQGRQAALNDVAETLGVSVDEAKTIIDEHRQRTEAEKSEAQRAKEAADREREEAEREKADAARERHATKVERFLIRAGVTSDDDDDDEATAKLDRVMRMVTAEPGASDDDIKAEVDTLRAQFPALFASADDDPPPTRPRTPSSDPPGTPPRRQASKGAYERGVERAKARFGRTD